MQDCVLIVEDDFDIANLISVQAEELSLQSEHCHNGEEAVQKALKNDYSLILLDVMLPGMNGFDVCRTIRQVKPQQVIMMLTSRSSETDRVVGLELGADDYITKPFSVRELQARMRVQLRHINMLAARAPVNEPEQEIKVGTLTIFPQQHQAYLQDTALDLTVTEFDLLHYLACHPNQVFTRSQLLSSVWGYDHSGYEHTVNSHINRLRAKVEKDAAKPSIIQTVWGVGYKFNPAGVMS